MRRGSFRFVELVALTPILLPFVWSSLIHLPGALRSTGVTRLHRYYGSSDSCRTIVRCPAGLIASCTEPSDHSVSNHPPSLQLLGLFSTAGRTAGTAPRNVFHPLGRAALASVGLRHGTAGSPRQKAESSSSSYGLVVHLLMLSTSPRGDAVSFGYGSQAGHRQGLAPCWFSTLAIAQPPARAGGSATGGLDARAE